MAKKNKNKVNPTGALLFAKQSGLTSFSSLWSIKHALNTDKVGHTGTLDSFADGLLVVLSGNLTHLVPHITGFSKTYQALVCFGKETDTLDPTGEVIKTGKSVTKEDVIDACSKFTGALLQVPPVYSAVHVNGKRASDVARSGKAVEIEPRQIFVYSNTLLDFKEATDQDSCSYALLEIKCSKGTYIRALARDMAYSLSSCAYLSGLRRTSVGPFKLEDAAGYSKLEPLTIESGLKKEALIKQENLEKKLDNEDFFDEIRSRFMTFTPSLASKCGFVVDELNQDFETSYLNGRPLNGRMFNRISVPDEETSKEYSFTDEIAVYYKDGNFAGMIQKKEGKLSYGFVVPPPKYKDFRVFSWDQIQRGAFPLQWKEKGTALTVGSFDGIHAGHNALLDAIMAKQNLVKGIVTFKSSYKKNEADFSGEVVSLHQKLDFCANKGLDFAIVIDFSEDFAKIEGYDFVQSLLSLCNLKYMAEGRDFSCGYKGSLTVEKLKDFAESKDFTLDVIEDVILAGERISSSRIRKAVINADFGLVQKMLLRPFEYDCYDIKWQKVSDGIFKSENVTSQVLPKTGNYDVVLGFRGENTLRTTCSIEEKTSIKEIILVLPEYDSVEGLKTISFIPVN